MALDARYVLAYHFEQYFVDKDTGAPLEGTVTFFRDNARTLPKNVYELSGTPPNYTYVSLGNEVNIANGVPTDLDGNNIAIYFFPFLGDPAAESTTIDLYYYETESSEGVLQFTREAQPNVFSGSGGTMVEENFVPNGQFKLHNDLPATDIAPLYDAGEVRANVTDIAPGGWTFELTDFAQSTDFILFDQHLPTTPDIAANPRYSIEIVCDDAGNLQTKTLALRFDDVNKFASTTQEYTYGFTAKSLSGSTLNNVQLNLHKDYGTGGSLPPTNTPITTFNIGISQTKFAFAFVFGDNSAKTIGSTLDDDFLQIQIILPGQLLDVEFTDFYLAIDDLVNENPDFPPTPDAEFIYKSLIPPVPAYDGFNLYLTERLTKAGKIYDDSEIGDVISESQVSVYVDHLHPSSNRMLADGAQYETTGYSPLGIPFARLQAKYWINSLNLPMWGTGPEFMTATIPAATNILLVSNNTEGAVTNAVNGGTSPGFTFATIHKETTAYFMNSFLFLEGGNEFVIKNKNVGLATSINPQTSGFTVAIPQTGTAQLRQISSVVPIALSPDPGNPGKYFTLSSINNSAVELDWYVWYQFVSETDPAGGGTGIKINLIAGDTAAIVAQKTWQALNGFQETTITTVAASTPIPAGAWFEIYSKTVSSSQLYAVWYEVNGAGTQPVVAGTPIYIKVVLVGTETAAQVATATQIAMNMKYFAAPDYRGMFFRAWDQGTNVDPGIRYSYVPGVTDNVLGTFELDMFKEHHHSLPLGGAAGGFGAGGGGLEPTSDDGGPEERPMNAIVNAVIKY